LALIENLKNKLKSAVNFPSPPAVAQQIIELASNPDIDVVKVASAIAKDPGLTAKILRVANSPLYSKRRKSENLRQALVVLGLNAATTLALSFSLVGTYKGVKSNGIDYTRYWRRTILCASAARAFGVYKQLNTVEDIFLAALLQDIAVIAIDRVEPDFYADLPQNATHAKLIAHELERLGMDHAALGSWLLKHWKLADWLCDTVAASHAPTDINSDPSAIMAARCVALGSECVELLLASVNSTDPTSLSAHAADWLGMGSQELCETMTQIVAEIPEIERLFDTTLDPQACTAMVEQARELLMIRNLQAIEQVSTLQQSADYFQTRAAEFEDKHRRDPLTGLYNRGYLDQLLENEFQGATAGGWPLSIVFVDLDRFKHVNDTYGHPAGDMVLVATAKLILAAVRDTDCVARYGGEEFMIILPGIEMKDAQIVCVRLLKRLRSTRHALADGEVTVTASLGLATHSPSAPFPNVAQFIDAADRSVYAAKQAGRDRLICHDANAWAHTA
jgi:diguanylate cyclase (GGDEF)-like protein